MKVVLQHRTSPDFQRQLEQHVPYWIDFVIVDEADTTTFTAEMEDTQVLLHVLEPVTAGVIAAAPQLRRAGAPSPEPFTTIVLSRLQWQPL